MNFWLHVLNIAMIFAIVSLGLNLLIGYIHIVSLALAGFFGIGAYTVAILTGTYGQPFGVALVLAVIVTALLSALSAWPALRLHGEYLMLLTIAFQMVLIGIFGSWRSVTGGLSGFTGISRPVILGTTLRTAPDFLPYIAFALLVAFVTVRRVAESPFGYVLKAIRDNEPATIALGKDVVAAKFKLMAVAGATAGLAGGIYAPYQAFISPAGFSLDISILFAAMVVLGGAGNLYGTLVGVGLIVLIPDLLRFLDISSTTAAPLRNLIYGSLLVLFMVFRPQGIIPDPVYRRRRKADATPEHDGAAGPVGPITVRPRGPQEPTGSALADDGSGEVLLAAKGLSKNFGGIRAAHDLSVELRASRVTALVGPNGAGKTTVFNLITGFIKPDSGTVELLGRNVDDVAAWRRTHLGMARTFQDVRLFTEMTALQNVTTAVLKQPGERIGQLFVRPRSTNAAWREARERAMDALRFVGLEHRRDELVSSLAFGEQKLVSLARLMATDARVMLLDEPASGVDRQWVNAILNLIEEFAAEGRAVCLVEHNLQVVRAVAPHAYFMNMGTIIAEGTPEDLLRDPKLGDIYFGAVQR